MIDIFYDTKRKLYRMIDQPTGLENNPMVETPWKEANAFNQKGFGIFWTVNEFDGVRRNENLKTFLSWYCEFDEGEKSEQSKKICEFIEPSLVIESKRGFQVYWNAKNETDILDYKEFVDLYLIPSLGCDKKVKDLARVLRAPNFYHMKNPAEPFLCTVVHSSPLRYSLAQMKKSFAPKTKQHEQEIKSAHEIKKYSASIGDGSLFEKIYAMDCEQALMVLSGTQAVGGEVFSFKPVSQGKKIFL